MMVITLIEKVYSFLWGDLFQIPLPGGGSVGISLLIILLIPTGIYFTIRTRFLPIRLFPEMVRSLNSKKGKEDGLSNFQTLIVSTATRVGMGNLVGVVAAISAGGAGAVFWMWITALIGSSTAFVEATLAQLHKEKDLLYGGYRGGPAYYIHHYMEEHQGKKKRYSVIAVLFAISGLICWCGISQVISNSVTSSFENAFSIPPIYTTVILVILAAVIVLRKNATVKVLDVVVPIMAVCYFLITVFLILTNLSSIPGVFSRIFEEAFGFRQAAAGGFGAVLMTLIYIILKNKNNFVIFITCSILGGLFETLCSYIQELLFGTVSWYYESDSLGILGQRTSIVYCLFWGILGIVWIRYIYPKLEKCIEKIPKYTGIILTWLLTVFLIFDMALSSAAVYRQRERRKNIPANNEIRVYLDNRYNDDILKKIYPNMTIKD